MGELKAKEKEEKNRKEKEDKKQAQEMRQAAMEGMSSMLLKNLTSWAVVICLTTL